VNNHLQHVKWTIILCCLMLLVPGCSLRHKSSQELIAPLVKPAQQSFEMADVRVGTIVKQVANSGTFVSKQSYPLFFKQSGSALQELKVSYNDIVKKGQVLAVLDPSNVENSIRAGQTALERATLLFQEAKNTSGVDAVTLKLKQMGIDAAQHQLNLLQEELAETVLTAPIDGVVTYLSGANVGDIIDAYTPIVTISDPNQLVFESILDNPDTFNEVQVGETVTVTVGNSNYSGHVIQTPNSAPATTMSLAANDQHSNIVMMAFDHLPKSIALGIAVPFVVTVKKKENTLIIPAGALKSFMGRSFVYVMNGNVRTEMGVETGINNGRDVEITAGLSAGQKVAVY